jgi:DNA-binding NarL/FixJ family response regulator
MGSGSSLPRSPSCCRNNDGQVRVLVVDDHPAVRAEVENVLRADAELAVVASAATASAAIAQALLHVPTLAIVDYRLPDRDGLSLTLALKRLPEAPRVLIYSAFADLRVTVGAIVAGADGVIEKTGDAEDLCAAVRATAAGRRTMPVRSAEAVRLVTARVAAEDHPIVDMLVDGAPPSEVAAALGVTREWLELRRWAILRQIIAPKSARW